MKFELNKNRVSEFEKFNIVGLKQQFILILYMYLKD